VRFVEATSNAEARQRERELEIESTEVQENTNIWAHAQAADLKPPFRETIEIGEIETGNMNL